MDIVPPREDGLTAFKQNFGPELRLGNTVRFAHFVRSSGLFIVKITSLIKRADLWDSVITLFLIELTEVESEFFLNSGSKCCI